DPIEAGLEALNRRGAARGRAAAVPRVPDEESSRRRSHPTERVDPARVRSDEGEYPGTAGQSTVSGGGPRRVRLARGRPVPLVWLERSRAGLSVDRPATGGHRLRREGPDIVRAQGQGRTIPSPGPPRLPASRRGLEWKRHGQMGVEGSGSAGADPDPARPPASQRKRADARLA